jgi:hypothetical protein
MKGNAKARAVGHIDVEDVDAILPLVSLLRTSLVLLLMQRGPGSYQLSVPLLLPSLLTTVVVAIAVTVATAVIIYSTGMEKGLRAHLPSKRSTRVLGDERVLSINVEIVASS